MNKIIKLNQLAWKVNQWHKLHPESTVVATNGCFDILHQGHRHYLKKSAELGDLLVVGINSDASVRSLKGSGRPVNPLASRCRALSALPFVDWVVDFPQIHALTFLKHCSPDIYTKGGDYDQNTINQRERKLLEEMHTHIAFIPGVPGLSTTGIIQSGVS